MSHAQETPKKRGFGQRQKILLLGVVVINLGIYGMMFLLSSGGGSGTNAPTPTEGKPLELQTVYEQALTTAFNWQADAHLVGATTSWQLGSGDRLTLFRSAWSFSFYSPSARRVQVVAVDRAGAQLGPQQVMDIAPQRVGLDWHLDSDDLLLTFLSYGGQEFMGAHPNANVHLQLKETNDGLSIWYITAVDPVARQSLLVGVDARSRQVVVLNETNKGGG